MILSSKGFDFLCENEGFESEPYLDVAEVPTIGIGTTFYPSGQHVTMKDHSITKLQAEQYAMAEITNVQNAVTAMVPPVLNQNQFDALVDFAYNEGTGALHGSTLLRLIKANPTDPGIPNAFLMWVKVRKDGILVYDAGLHDRRQREIDLYFS